jgi:hypothetical protein
MIEFKSLNEIQVEVYIEYKKNGYYGMWQVQDFIDTTPSKFNIHRQRINDIAELGLIVTEVSEAIEDIRKGDNGVSLGVECADIIIRTLNFMSRKGLNAQYFILEKNQINLKREKLHGKEV